MSIHSSKQVAIITDSIACLTPEQAARYAIGVVPANIIYDGKAYKDGIDITPSGAYELFLKNPDIFSSSAPSPTDFLKAYHEASKQASNILCITLSSKLSAIYNAAKIARDYAKKELPGVTIEVMDSWTVASGEGFIVLAAAKAAEEGKSLDEVSKVAGEIKARVNVLMLMDTVRHVYRTGRIPKIASQAGSMLNIRPLMSVSGGMNFAGVARSRENGIELLMRKMREKVGEKPVHVAVQHAYIPEEAEKLKKRVSDEFNCREIWIGEFSPLVGYACGTGTLGLAFYTED